MRSSASGRGAVGVGGFDLAFEERGEGAPAVFVHGEASTRGVWDATLEALGSRFRTIAYDRRGYGGSGAPESYAGTTVEEQAEDAAALIERLDAAPALLCGHAFGAVVCLDLVRRRPELASAAVLVEPPLLALSPTGADVTAALREAIEQGAREGGGAGAIDAFLREACGGRVPPALGRARPEPAAARAFAADLAATPRWELDLAALRAITVPLSVVVGARTRSVWREVCEALVERLESAELRELCGGHFAQLDAPSELAGEIGRMAARAAR
jgi:pimeloyl-ACP methyl ester carboxylesterase